MTQTMAANAVASGPTPPYDPAVLGTKLTAPQRTAIIKWITELRILGSIDGIPAPAVLQKESDAELINDYANLYVLTKVKVRGITGPGSDLGQVFSTWSEGLTALLNKLFDKNFWLRALEIGIGIVLLGVGLAKLTNLGPSLSKIPVYGKAITS